MFKSTKNLRAEQFDRLTEDVGGANNASTGDDVTEYHEVVPSNHLETLLWAEAERHDEPQGRRGELQVGARGRQGGVPPARPRLAVRPPLQRDLVGVVPRASLQAAGHRQHRGPRGGDARRRRRLPLRATTGPTTRRSSSPATSSRSSSTPGSTSTSAPVPRPSTPLPRFEASEPPWQADRVAQVTGPQVPLPAVAITWLAPPVTSADAPALQVAARCSPPASRRASTSRSSTASASRTQAGFSADLRVGPGLLIAYAIAAGGKPSGATSAQRCSPR